MAYQFEKSGKLKDLTAEEQAGADKDSAIIVCNSGVLADGSPYWAYISIKPTKYQDFMRATAEQKTIDVEDYGTVLKYGFEKEIPPHIHGEIKQQYGWDENFMAMLAQNVRAAQIAFLKEQETNQLNDIVAMLKKNKSSNC